MTPPTLSLENIPLQNGIVFWIILLIILLTLRRIETKDSLIPMDDTQELKGFAMITVIFVHIGYSLVGNWQFLSPISSLGGVGVDIFLFLSGYGLSISMYKKPLGIFEFYKGRLLKILIPFWIIFLFLLLMDWSILHTTYEWKSIWQSLLVYFPTAYIWQDINSPLWYMMWLLVFYILFPIFYFRDRPWLTSIILATITSLLVYYNPLDLQVTWLHKLHTLAFPLGIWVASLVSSGSPVISRYLTLRDTYSKKFISIGILIFALILGYGIWKIDAGQLGETLGLKEKYPSIGVILEQIRSILLLIVIVFFFSWKSWQSRFLWIYGVVSYEIYLIHWPLFARYDIFFAHLPAWAATLIWIVLLISIGWLLQKWVAKLSGVPKKS